MLLNVLMISPQFSPLVGGYERAAERLAAALIARPEVGQVEVVTERRNRVWAKVEERSGVVVRRLWCWYAPRVHVISATASLFWYLLLNLRRFHVVHVHQYGYPAAIAIILGKLLGRPVILKITSTGSDGISNALQAVNVAGGLLASLHRRVDACVATTRDAAREAVSFGIPASRIHVVPNGVDTLIYTPWSPERREQARRAVGIGEEMVALYCGRLSLEKNIDGLVQAWRLVIAVVPTARLVVVGEGPLQLAVADYVRQAGLEASVSLVGGQADVVPWYQAADLFVLPSHHEGLSNSLLEAMSCGLPVVSTRVSGSSDILSDADVGELVEPGDQAALAQSLSTMLSDAQRRQRCGVNARQYVEKRFAIDRVAGDMVKLYEGLSARAGEY